MSFSLVKFRAWPERPGAATPEKGFQYAYFEIDADVTDVILDFGDSGGLLWSDLDDTAAGANALTVIEAIQDACEIFLGVEGNTLFDRVQVASLTTTGEKKLEISSNCPKISVNTGDGETTWKLLLRWRLKDTEFGQTAAYST